MPIVLHRLEFKYLLSSHLTLRALLCKQKIFASLNSRPETYINVSAEFLASFCNVPVKVSSTHIQFEFSGFIVNLFDSLLQSFIDFYNFTTTLEVILILGANVEKLFAIFK